MRFWYLTDAPQVPRGGQVMIQEQVKGLRELGHQATLLLPPSARRCVPPWLEVPTDWVAVSHAAVGADDVLVVPESYEWWLKPGRPGRIVVLNQLALPSTSSVDLRVADRYQQGDVRAVLVVDDRWAPATRQLFGAYASVHVTPNVVRADGVTPSGKTNTILFSSQKHRELSRAVLNLLISRGRAGGWRIVESTGVSRTEWLEAVAAARIVLTFEPSESFGLVAAEALALEATVIGFAGEPRAAYWDLPTARSVPWRDIERFVSAIEEEVAAWDSDPLAGQTAGRAAARLVTERYDKSRLLTALDGLATSMAHATPGCSGVVRHPMPSRARALARVALAPHRKVLRRRSPPPGRLEAWPMN